MRWSDGSLQLLVGDEALDVAELDMGRDHNFLFLRHIQAQLLEARAGALLTLPCFLCRVFSEAVAFKGGSGGVNDVAMGTDIAF